MLNMTCPCTVVALGEAMLRLTTRVGDRLDQVGELGVHVAGSEANVAVGLAHLGVDVAWLSRVPATPLGRRVIADLRGAGVDVANVRWAGPDARLGLFFAEAGLEPRATRVWYDRRGSAFAQMTPDDLDADVLSGAEWALVSGITPALGASARALAERFVNEARSRGVDVCVDVNYRAQLWSALEARAALDPLLGQAGLVVCARADAERVFDLQGSDSEIVRALRDRWCPRAEVVVLTLGERGCVAIDGDGQVLSQAAIPTSVVDPFGAGDAFVAGLLWGLIGGVDLAGALARGTAVAALKCTLRGDQARVDVGEVESLLRDGGVELMR
ncbi:MAG: 2-keto-3-deoxygluconate kinase [Conexibacter sp.]|nr:2-keto-3-deoxygluconate kinase [Conexibacter sp.]